MIKVGVLEDDETLARLYQAVLAKVGHECACYGTIAGFLAALRTEKFDILMLDWTLPDGNSGTVIKQIREKLGWLVPVLVVTGRGSESDIIGTLGLGADDYVIKPPRMFELVARIEALARRSNPLSKDVLRLGPYTIDPRAREIRIDGEPVELTQKEFELASHLFQNRGKLLSRMHLLKTVWGQTAEIDTRTVDAHVSRLRRKLDLTADHGWEVTSVYGHGYRLEQTRSAEDAESQEPI